MKGQCWMKTSPNNIRLEVKTLISFISFQPTILVYKLKHWIHFRCFHLAIFPSNNLPLYPAISVYQSVQKLSLICFHSNQMSGAMVSDKVWNTYSSSFVFTWEQTVQITKYFYPSLSVAKLLSDLGGSLGLWLGVGILQICLLSSELIERVQNFFRAWLLCLNLILNMFLK